MPNNEATVIGKCKVCLEPLLGHDLDKLRACKDTLKHWEADTARTHMEEKERRQLISDLTFWPISGQGR